MATQLFQNNATTTLATNLTALDTTIVVTDGSKFPTISTAGDFFVVTLDDGVKTEIVKVTGHTASSPNLTGCTRAHESTTAAVFASPTTTVSIRITAGYLQGGGGGGFALWDPHAVPTSPSSLDVEFNTGSSLGSDWTAINIQSATNSIGTVRPGFLNIVPNGTTGAWRGYVKNDVTLQNGDWTLQTHIVMGILGSAYHLMGFGVTDGVASSNAFTHVYGGYHASYGPSVVGERYTNWSTFAASTWTPGPAACYDILLRFRRSGSNYFQAWSTDGRTWIESASFTLPYTPTNYCLTWYNNQATLATFGWDYVRYSTSATATWGRTVSLVGS